MFNEVQKCFKTFLFLKKSRRNHIIFTPLANDTESDRRKVSQVCIPFSVTDKLHLGDGIPLCDWIRASRRNLHIPSRIGAITGQFHAFTIHTECTKGTFASEQMDLEPVEKRTECIAAKLRRQFRCSSSSFLFKYV